MLSIGDFSQVCHLSTQTLRFYHSEGLLVPAEVDERTGYRTYTFDQVETAMLVMVLRGTGMSVRDVHRALDDPDALPCLLAEHSTALQRRRAAEDEALRDARELVEAWPQVQRRHTPAVTVLSAVVPGPPDRDAATSTFDWEWTDSATTATLRTLAEVARSRALHRAGTPWRTDAIETVEQKIAAATLQGPHWVAKLPVAGPADPLAESPEGVEVQWMEARDELSITLPGRMSMAKFATAISRLVTHAVDGAYVDMSRTREVVHDGSVEVAMALITVGEAE